MEWLNLVDTSYRQEFKDLFEANFLRVESEMAGLRVEMRGLREHVEARITGLEGVMNARLLGVEGRMVELQGRLLAQMDARMERVGQAREAEVVAADLDDRLVAGHPGHHGGDAEALTGD